MRSCWWAGWQGANLTAHTHVTYVHAAHPLSSGALLQGAPTGSPVTPVS